MDDRIRLTELVCARLCHDLSGLLGSLVGTLELVTEASEDTEAASIVTATATALALRLKLLRAAWGGQPEPLDLPRLTALAHGLVGRRVGLDVSGLPETASVGRRWKFRRNLVIFIACQNGVPQRLLADVFDLPHSRIAAIVKEFRTKYAN